MLAPLFTRRKINSPEHLVITIPSEPQQERIVYVKCVADRGRIRELIKVESKQNNAISEMLVMRTFHAVVVLVNVSKLSTYKRSAPNSSTMLHPNLKYQNIITIRDLHRIQFNVVEDDIQFNVLEDRTSDANLYQI